MSRPNNITAIDLKPMNQYQSYERRKAHYQQPIPNEINHQITDSPQQTIPRENEKEVREVARTIDQHIRQNDTVRDIRYSEESQDYEADDDIGQSLFSQRTLRRVEDPKAIDAKDKLDSCMRGTVVRTYLSQLEGKEALTDGQNFEVQCGIQ